ncbi:MAG TPA: DNA methyltransferase [Kofleriaceae bacterium]|nr:DNA methyltransferase [Kofleriaceae bacterium]
MSSRPGPPPPRQRRALSVVRGGGRVERGGDRALAEGLAEALRAPDRDPDAARTFTHGFHTYPARMDPAMARALLAGLGGRGAVLDPFCGSGTTLVEARAAGRASTGGDLNPLAVAIARSKTWTAPPARRRALLETARAIAAEALEEGKAARRAGHHPAPLRRAGKNPSARDRTIGEWFAPHVRRELEQIAALIDGEPDRELREHLRVLLSSILYKVSRRASDTDPRRVERNIARGNPARLFAARAELLAAGLDELAARPGPMPRVLCADARRLEVPAGGFELCVTSPPYAGTYDYADLHGLRMAFLGIDPGELERHEMGARARFAGGPDRRARALGDYGRDLAAALAAVARALAPGGRAALVVGDSLAGRAPVRADELVRRAVAAPLALVAWAGQERPALGGAEKRAFAGGAPKREHILLLERTSG